MDTQSSIEKILNELSSVLIPEKDIPIDIIIKTVEAIARLTYKSLYLIDYYTKSFPYVSLNPLFLCGYTSHEVQRMGYHFYENTLSEEDLNFVVSVNRAAYHFLKERPIEKLIHSSISYTFYINQKKENESSNQLLITHQLTPLLLDKNGRVHLAMCAVALAHSSKKHHAEINFEGDIIRWIYQNKTHKWKAVEKLRLTENEKIVIALSRQGYSLQDIAVFMHKSIDSIKVYRKKLFQKLNVNNISEAIAYATHHKLI